MGRRHHFKEFFATFDIKWIKHCIKAGRDSGYDKCCVAWFFIRILLMHAYGTIMGNVNPFMGEVRSFRTKEELKVWQNSLEYRRKLKHVACPIHSLIYFLTKKEHHYIMCKECAWIQYEVHDCNNCAQDDFYQTKARRMKGRV